jgi:ankyrin repeat protein
MRERIGLLLLFSAPNFCLAADLRLVEAAQGQDRNLVGTLLKQNVDVNTPQGDGATALHWAVYWDDPAMTDILIRAGANVNATNELGVTPLALASSGAMAGLLLDAGANPNLVTATGESPLMAASRAGRADIVTVLLEHGANVDAKENVRGQTALMWAVSQRHPEVVRLLLQHGADVSVHTRSNPQLVYTGDVSGAGRNPAEWVMRTLDRGGSTALMFAARQGDLESAKLLLAAGANPNETGPDGMTALVLASYSGHGDVVAFLLSKDASPNAADAGYTALHTAVLRGDVELVKTLLKYGANPNARITQGTPITREGEDLVLPTPLVGATAFFLAAKFLEADIMRVLAKGGGDTRTGLADGTTPLMAVTGIGWGGEVDRRDAYVLQGTPFNDGDRALETAKLALELGADVNATNDAGDTALHGAASKGYDAIVQELADKGAQLEVKNKRGRTPLMAAKKSTADLLRKLGAKE